MVIDFKFICSSIQPFIHAVIQLNLDDYVISLCRVLCWAMGIQRKLNYILLWWDELLHISHCNKAGAL